MTRIGEEMKRHLQANNAVELARITATLEKQCANGSGEEPRLLYSRWTCPNPLHLHPPTLAFSPLETTPQRRRTLVPIVSHAPPGIERLDDTQRRAVMMSVADRSLPQEEALRLMEAYVKIEQGLRQPDNNDSADDAAEGGPKDAVRVMGVEVVEGSGLVLTPEKSFGIVGSPPQTPSETMSPTPSAGLEPTSPAAAAPDAAANGGSGNSLRLFSRLFRSSRSASTVDSGGSGGAGIGLRGIDGRQYSSPQDAFYHAIEQMDDDQRRAIMNAVRSAQFTIDEALALVKSYVAQETFAASNYVAEAPSLATQRVYHTPEGTVVRDNAMPLGSRSGSLDEGGETGGPATTAAETSATTQTSSPASTTANHNRRPTSADGRSRTGATWPLDAKSGSHLSIPAANSAWPHDGTPPRIPTPSFANFDALEGRTRANTGPSTTTAVATVAARTSSAGSGSKIVDGEKDTSGQLEGGNAGSRPGSTPSLNNLLATSRDASPGRFHINPPAQQQQAQQQQQPQQQQPQRLHPSNPFAVPIE